MAPCPAGDLTCLKEYSSQFTGSVSFLLLAFTNTMSWHPTAGYFNWIVSQRAFLTASSLACELRVTRPLKTMFSSVNIQFSGLRSLLFSSLKRIKTNSNTLSLSTFGLFELLGVELVDKEARRCSRAPKHEYKPLEVYWYIIAHALLTAWLTDVIPPLVLTMVWTELLAELLVELLVALASCCTTLLAWFKQCDNLLKFSSILWSFLLLPPSENAGTSGSSCYLSQFVSYACATFVSFSLTRKMRAQESWINDKKLNFE